MADSLKQKTVRGVIWNALGKFSTQGVSFVISIILARLLLPSDYGIIAMLGIFTAIASTFIDSGLTRALIRKQDRTEADLSTMFYFNIAVSTVCYLLIFIAAPWIADFYDTPELTLVARIACFTLVLNAFCAIQSIQFSFRIDFKTPAKIGFATTILSGIAGIVAAYAGLSYWALVVQTYAATILRLVFLLVLVRWRPKVGFSKASFKDLFGYSSKLLASSLLDTVYGQIYPIVIAKAFSPADLGLYTRARGWAQFPSSNITNILQGVTFPVLSTLQDDDERLAVNYRKIIRLSGFVIFPLMIGLAAVADPLTRFVLTDRWAGSIPLLQIICFSMMWYPIHAINLNLLQVKGRSDLFLKLEIIKKILGVGVLVVTIPMGLIAMCWGSLVSSLFALVINTHYTGKLIKVGFFRQMFDLTPTIINSFVMGSIVYGVQFLVSDCGIKLVVGMLIGAIYYGVSNCVLRTSEWQELLLIIKRR